MTQKEKTYPTVGQSILITAFVIVVALVLSPLTMLSSFINPAAVFLFSYTAAMGIPFLVIYHIRKKKSGKSTFNYSVESPKTIPLMIVAIFGLFVGVINPVVSLIPMPDSIREVLMGFASQRGVYAFLTVVVAAPVLEELIFRGIILDGLLKNYSPAKAILISSLLFGLVHLNPWQFVAAFVLGLFIGWIYYRTRSISLSIIIHAAYNLMGFLLRYIIDMGGASNKTLIESYGGVTFFVLAITGSIIIVTVCIHYLNRGILRKA